MRWWVRYYANRYANRYANPRDDARTRLIGGARLSLIFPAVVDSGGRT